MLHDIKSAVTRARAWAQMGKFDNAIVALADSLYVLGYYVNQKLPDESKPESPSTGQLLTLYDLKRQVDEAIKEMDDFSTKHGMPIPYELPEMLPLGDFEIRRRKV